MSCENILCNLELLSIRCFSNYDILIKVSALQGDSNAGRNPSKSSWTDIIPDLNLEEE